MATFAPISYSENREYLANSSADGVIKIWETETGSLRQEYTPSSHLSASCTCLSWSPSRTIEGSPRKKKKKKSSRKESLVQGADLIAIGTTSGTVLLYSYLNGDLQTEMESSHSERINDVCWSTNGEELYACASDQHVTEWDVKSTKVKHKWKVDKGSVNSICCCSHQHFLSAGRSIKLWDLPSKTLLQTFTGHSKEVFRLLPVHKASSGDGDSSSSSSYFLSAALEDRLINVWNINTSKKSKNAVGSFILPEEPVMMDISHPVTTEKPLVLAVVTKGGEVLVFEHILNGKLKKPLEPKFRIECVSPGDKDLIPKPINILAAALVQGRSPSILITHGLFLKPTFEKVDYTGGLDICLIRQDPLSNTVQVQSSISKVKTPVISNNVTDLAPSALAPAKPALEDGKRRKRKTSVTELSIEDRLNAISIDTERSGAAAPPKADTLALLLTQGLQSQDKNILNNVLQTPDEKIIQNTIKRLPVPLIIPLIKEISWRMEGHAQSGHKYVTWIKTLLTVHTSYLMTFPELVEKFSGMYQMMSNRVTMFSRLSKLQGKLDLILSHISAQDEEVDETPTTSQALLVYQDDSSDEDGIGLDDLITGQSDSEENWEDMSDIDVEDQEDNKMEDDEIV